MKYYPNTKLELKELVDNLDISLNNIDVSNITDMSCLFYDTDRKYFSGIENWNVSNVIDMSYMFAFSRFNKSVGKWKYNGSVNKKHMFD